VGQGRWSVNDFDLVVETPVRMLRPASVELVGSWGHYAVIWSSLVVATINLEGDDIIVSFPRGFNQVHQLLRFGARSLPLEYSWFVAMRILNQAQRALNGNIDAPRVSRCFNCMKIGHRAQECKFPQKCKNCYGNGHQANQCPSPVRQKAANVPKAPVPAPRKFVKAAPVLDQQPLVEVGGVVLPPVVMPQPEARYADIPVVFEFERESSEEPEESEEEVVARRIAKGKAKELPGPSGFAHVVVADPLRIVNPRERHDKEDEMARKGGSLKAAAKGGRSGANGLLIKQSIMRSNAEQAGARDAMREKRQEECENAVPLLPAPIAPHDPTPSLQAPSSVLHTATFLWSSDGWKHSLEDPRFATLNGVTSMYWTIMLLIVGVLSFNLYTAELVLGQHPVVILLQCVLLVLLVYVGHGFLKNLLLIGFKLRKSVTVSVTSPERDGRRILGVDSRPESMKNGPIKYESNPCFSKVDTSYSVQVDHFVFYLLFWVSEFLWPWDAWMTLWDAKPVWIPYDRELLSHYLNPRSAGATTKYSNVRTSLTIAASAHTATNIHRDETILSDPVNNTVRIACIVHGSNLERFQIAPGFH
jgi:hypothetical protein